MKTTVRTAKRKANREAVLNSLRELEKLFGNLKDGKTNALLGTGRGETGLLKTKMLP